MQDRHKKSIDRFKARWHLVDAEQVKLNAVADKLYARLLPDLKTPADCENAIALLPPSFLRFRIGALQDELKRRARRKKKVR